MPIRFRCAYCNQLMGIARRKAGTVVRCPTCAGQVVVPQMGPEGTNVSGDPQEPLFERSDFDQLLKPAMHPQPPVVAPQPGPAPPAGAWGTHAEPAFDVERIDPGPVPQGLAMPGPGQPRMIVLTSTKATIFLVAAILAVAVAFGMGLVIGQLLR